MDKSFWSGVAASFTASLILAILVWIRSGVELSWAAVRLVIRNYKRLSDVGFASFYASRADYARYRGAAKLGDYLSWAKSEIVVISWWMAQGAEIEGVVDKLASLIRQNRHLTVSIAIVDPRSDAVGLLAKYLGLTDDDVRTRVTRTLDKLYQMSTSLSDEENRRLDLRVYTSLPAFSTILLDPDTENCVVQVDVKVYGHPQSDSFSLEFRGQDKHMPTLVVEATRSCFENATPFDPLMLAAPVQPI